MLNQKQETRIHEFFEVTIFLKGFLAILEVLGGVFTFFLSRNLVSKTLFYVSQEGIFSNPDSFLVHRLTDFLQNFSASTQHFVAVYLFIHGAVKLFIVWSLFTEKKWSYPMAILVFGIFAIYEILRFSHTHSLMLLFVTVLDVLIICLTVHEYNYKKSKYL